MAHNDEKAETTGPAASHQPGWVNQWTIYALGGATAIALILAVTGWNKANSYQEQANGLRAEIDTLKGRASDLQGQVAALQGQVKDAQNKPPPPGPKYKAQWEVFQISHQRSRYVYELYYEKEAISRQLYDWLLKNGYADPMLIAKWKKQGYEKV